MSITSSSAVQPSITTAADINRNPEVANATGDPAIGTSIFTGTHSLGAQPHITGPSINDSADFDTGFFAGEKGHLDVKKHVFGYKKQQEITRRMRSYQGEYPASHPPFSPDSPAACVDLTEALPVDIPNIVYSADDDAVLEAFVRGNVSTT